MKLLTDRYVCQTSIPIQPVISRHLSPVGLCHPTLVFVHFHLSEDWPHIFPYHAPSRLFLEEAARKEYPKKPE